LNGSVELSVVKLILQSSIFTWIIYSLLLLLSVFSWTIILNKYLFITSYRNSIGEFLKQMTSQGGAQLEDICMKMSSSTAKTMPILILKMLRYREQGKSIPASDAVINNVVMHEYNKLTENMNILATAANISPLLGLLGTVWGIMFSFINIGQQGSASISTVAPGIAEALLTTIAGLLVAIPAMVGHNFLMNSVYKCQDTLDRVADFAHEMFGKSGVS